MRDVYMAAGRADDMQRVLTVMSHRKLQKQDGISQLEVLSAVSGKYQPLKVSVDDQRFVDDRRWIDNLLKSAGYVQTDASLAESAPAVEAGEEDLSGCGHTEMLALAHALRVNPKDRPIRITKNVRVCLNCHEATKCVAKVTGRDIYVRDANVSHHCRPDGTCSCGDYWS